MQHHWDNVSRGRSSTLGVAASVTVLLVAMLFMLRGLGGGKSASTTVRANPQRSPAWGFTNWSSHASKPFLKRVAGWGPGVGQAPKMFADGCGISTKALTLSFPPGDLVTFDKGCLTAPANTSFTIELTNHSEAISGKTDSGAPINLSIYPSPEDAFVPVDPAGNPSPGGPGFAIDPETLSKALFRGEWVSPGNSITYQIPPLSAGTYYLQSEFEPTALDGVLIVR
jgi:hypothetical protein